MGVERIEILCTALLYRLLYSYCIIHYVRSCTIVTDSPHFVSSMPRIVSTHISLSTSWAVVDSHCPTLCWSPISLSCRIGHGLQMVGKFGGSLTFRAFAIVRVLGDLTGVAYRLQHGQQLRGEMVPLSSVFQSFLERCNLETQLARFLRLNELSK